MARTVETGDEREHFVPEPGTAADVATTIADGFGGSLTAAIGQRFPTADGHGQLVFFWHNDHFLGWNSVYESMSILSLRSAAAGEFTVSYAHYAAADPACCPSLPPLSITYRFTGTKLVASGTPPNLPAPGTFPQVRLLP
jgi:hypothetical protein